MKKTIILFLLIAFLVNACSGNQKEPVTPTLTILTHDSFEVSADLITAFENQNHVKLVFLKSGDAGQVLNKAILSKDNPLADVLYGVDNTFLSRALDSGIFDSYGSPLLSNISDEFKLDPQNTLLPVDFGDVCINYDRTYFSANNLPVPGSFEDLLEPLYKGLLVMENPATSSPGLAFMLATIAHFGSDNFLTYWQGLVNNGLVVVGDWSTAYYTNFSGSSGHGSQPMVVSYASSPAAEVIFAETKLTEAPTASITASGMCFRQVEFVGILKGTQQKQLAEKFVDFMLDIPFQEDMPLQMFVYPVNPGATLPPEFMEFSRVVANPATFSSGMIASNRDEWIASWQNTVLH
jgi:thiamine transport system substrate-binding protein